MKKHAQVFMMDGVGINLEKFKAKKIVKIDGVGVNLEKYNPLSL